jgi:hypothetical protein
MVSENGEGRLRRVVGELGLDEQALAVIRAACSSRLERADEAHELVQLRARSVGDKAVRVFFVKAVVVEILYEEIGRAHV